MMPSSWPFAHFFGVDGTTEYNVEDIILGLYGVTTDFSDPTNDGIVYVRHYDLSTDPVIAFSLGTELGGGALSAR